jgi:hypothetical protein
MSTLIVESLSATQFAALSTAQVASLSSAQIATLSTEQIAALSTTQLGAISVTALPGLTTTQITSLETTDIAALTSKQIAALTTTHIAALSTDQIQSISEAGMAALTAKQAPGFSTAQMAALTSTQISAFSKSGIAALSSDQVSAIEVDDVWVLSTTQIGAMTSKQVAGLSSDQLTALASRPDLPLTALSATAIPGFTTEQVFFSLQDFIISQLTSKQIAALTTTQIGAFGDSQIQSITEAGIAALTATQAPGFGPAQMAALTSAQVGAFSKSGFAALSITQLRAIETGDLEALSTTQIGALTPKQLPGLSTEQLGTLSADQLRAFSVTALPGFTTNQIASLETTDIAALTSKQIAALTTTQIGALSTEHIASLSTFQVSALTSPQIKSLSSAQIASLSTTQVSYLKMVTPIALDLNGDGVRTQSIQAGIKFDITASGYEVSTGWLSPEDGFLVLDRNQDGIINDGSELFGSATELADGSRASDGYTALQQWDSDQNGEIDANDAVFPELRVWVDHDGDGHTDAGELKSLNSLGVTSISLVSEVGQQIDNGNLIGLTSVFKTADGASHTVADVWFTVDATGDSQIDRSASSEGRPKQDQADTAPGVKIAADVTRQPVPASLSTPAPVSSFTFDNDQLQMQLASQTSQMAQAIRLFEEVTPTLASVDVKSPNVPIGEVIEHSQVSMVGQMANSMAHFNSNGKTIYESSFSTIAAAPSAENIVAGKTFEVALAASPIGDIGFRK